MKRIEQIAKNILLKLLLLFSSSHFGNKPDEIGSHSRVLVIRLNRIGDALVTTPLLHLLKVNLRCHITVLADKKNHFIFQNNPNVDKVIIFKKGLQGFLKVKRYIKQNNVDVLIDSHDDVSTTVSFIAAFSNVRRRFALRKDNYKLFTDTINKPDPSEFHVIDRIKKIGELFNITMNKNETAGIEYYPREESLNLANEWIDKINPDNKFLLGINISAGSDARFWGADNYYKLVKFLESYDIITVIFSAEEHYKIAKQIIRQENIFPAEYSYDEIDAAIMRLNLLFSPDTALVHIASVKKIPVFGIYVKYNTDDLIWSPYKTPFDCVITKEPTLKNVYFETVQKKFIGFLEKQIHEQNYS